MKLFFDFSLGKDFWNFRAGQLISLLGDSCSNIALAWWILDKTHSAIAMSSVLAPAMLVRIFLLPLMGPLGDNFSRSVTAHKHEELIKMKINTKALTPAGQSILMSPGEMIRTLRDLKGWSQLDLSSETGISQTNISAIENGRTQIGKERAIVLAKALNVHPGSIMFADYEYVA